MTHEQQEHMIRIRQNFDKLMSEKYRKGAIEHGGNLWDLSKKELLDNAIDEAIDQVVYLLTLKEKPVDKD